MKAQNQKKKVITIVCIALGLAALAAPKVKVDKIENTSVWSTKKVTYTVSDVPAASVSAGGCVYTLAFDVTAYSVTKKIEKGYAQNGTFTETLDAATIFGETRKDPKAKVRVSLEKRWDLTPVQLWENGPYFAQCNIGATKPEECGYYFWWGDTVGCVRNANNDGWVSAKDGTTSIEFSMDKSPANTTYIHDTAWLKSNGWIDDGGNLMAAHDAATAYLGVPWRMPTVEELKKLVDTSICEWTWTTSWEGTGKPGYVVKGKGAYASNSIFLPGDHGFYWSSNLWSNNSGRSSFLEFYSGSFETDHDVGWRFERGSVRAVRDLVEFK